MTACPILCIDGPSGAGKGTVSRIIASRLGLHLLDSGALYRLTALAAELAGVALNEEVALAQIALQLDIRFEALEDTTQVWLGQRDVSLAIRTESAGMGASQVAALPAVRQALLARQRAFATAPGLVADGRDMGTVVFPEAQLKIFLTASPQARAQRRLLQLERSGITADLAVIAADIEARDFRDANRSIAPLIPAVDAIVIDSTPLSIQQVVDQILVHWHTLRSV